MEAKKVLVNELGATLLTIANDVKVQVEFNPATVKAYRLIGYENRMFAKEDFNDDRKDAGEMGAGHSVTALYEIELALADGVATSRGVDDLKYQPNPPRPSGDMLTVKFRYKKPGTDISTKFSKVVDAQAACAETMSRNLAFASAVAEFGLLLRDSPFKASATFESLIARARAAKGEDASGTRAEFVKLAETAQNL